MANSVDPDQIALIGAVCSGSTLFASILYSTVMLGNYLQQTTSAGNIFRCIFFLAQNIEISGVQGNNNRPNLYLCAPLVDLEEWQGWIEVGGGSTKFRKKAMYCRI